MATIEEPLKNGLRQRAILGSSKECLRGKLCLPTVDSVMEVKRYD